MHHGAATRAVGSCGGEVRQAAPDRGRAALRGCHRAGHPAPRAQAAPSAARCGRRWRFWTWTCCSAPAPRQASLPRCSGWPADRCGVLVQAVAPHRAAGQPAAPAWACGGPGHLPALPHGREEAVWAHAAAGRAHVAARGGGEERQAAVPLHGGEAGRRQGKNGLLPSAGSLGRGLGAAAATLPAWL